MRFATLAPFFLALTAQSWLAAPTKRDTDDLECPFVFNEKGEPSLFDLTSNEKPHDMGSLAIAAALVALSPAYVANMFKYTPGKDTETKTIPRKAKLRPAEGEGSCRPRAFETFHLEANTRDRDSETDSSGKDMYVEFRGEPESKFIGAYIGNELYEMGDNVPSSAWVYILQYTFLAYARKDAEAGHKWVNTDAVAAVPGLPGSAQKFNQLEPQKYDNLKHMLGLVVGKETSWKPVTELSDDELKKTLNSASMSPVLIIPKKSSKGLDSSRIWIASNKVAEKVRFFNPIEKDKGVKKLSIDEVKESAESIVFITDHSALKA